MAKLGINWPALALQGLLLLLVVFLPALLTLADLRQRPLSDTARALWVILILVFPWMGAVAYWVVRPWTRPAP